MQPSPRSFASARCALIGAIGSVLVADIAHAQSTPAPTVRLPPVVVTATRIDTPSFDVPASIDRIDGDVARDARLQVNISDALASVPGLLARDRQNYAQDVQISVRGFGARSTFGIRGVRLYVDGIPATLPDGQGQITNVDLGSVGHFEVLRGPFSALYGNSSGGVIQVFTEEPGETPTLGFGVAGGSDDALRISTKLSARSGAFGVVASASRFTTDGYREHSAAERRIGNLKLNWQPDDASRFTLIANSVSLPKAQDPLGLTRAQFEANPRGVDPVANTFNTRKTVDQTQAGLIYERRIDGANALRAMVYGGRRETEQFQAIPVGPQANPLHPGGVISLVRDYSGADLRWTLNAGVRHSEVRFRSNDRYIVGTNPDDSGGADYSATLPVLGVMFAVDDSLHLYATAGRGFETPTLNELAYRPGGATGLNFDLKPARSDSVELGAKWRSAAAGEWRAAIFRTTTHDEIATLASAGGRATFRNAGATQRRGLELAWSATFVGSLEAQASATWLDARYRDAFAGARIPGIARSALFMALGWRPPQGWRAGVELRALSHVMVNDANSDAAAGYALLGAHAGYVWRAGRWELSGFVRGDNLADRRVIGSLIVNEANGRYFEPAPGRTWLAGVNAQLSF